MKLVEGRTLDQLLLDEKYASNDEEQLFRVLQIFVRVCEAVGFAHSRGIVHCDLKPSNVMVGSHGQVYLMDWGIARKRGEAEFDMLAGTFGYMAPEQFDALPLDERTDVFALGALLYRIVIGRPPYGGRDEKKSIEQGRTAEIFAPDRVARWTPLPRRLVAIALRALSRDPRARHATAEELAGEVEAWLRGDGRFPTRNYAPGEVVVREGEVGDCAFVIRSGRCEVSKTVDGVRRVLRVMGPGDVFGEMAIFTGQARSATVEAVGETVLAVVSRESLEEEMNRAHVIAQAMKAVTQRYYALDARATELEKHIDTYALASRLWQTAALTGRKSKGKLKLKWPKLRAELAAELNIPPADIEARVKRVAGVTIEGDSLVFKAAK
jgi:serine/threonine-protein kinase